MGSDETFKTQAALAVTFAASFTHTEAKGQPFGEPSAVAVGPSGNIFVADGSRLHDRILEFNAKHEYLRQFGSAGSGAGQFNQIGGIAIDASGDLYVSDSGNNRVEEFNAEGKYLSKFGCLRLRATGSCRLRARSRLTSGDIWVLDAANYRVEEFSSDRRIHLQVRRKRAGRRKTRLGDRPRRLGREPVRLRTLQRQSPGVLQRLANT